MIFYNHIVKINHYKNDLKTLTCYKAVSNLKGRMNISLQEIPPSMRMPMYVREVMVCKKWHGVSLLPSVWRGMTVRDGDG